jgi:Na+(H+)/acetate symporter ActP
LAFAVAASTNLPTILFSLYWKRFTTTGAVVVMDPGRADRLAAAVGDRTQREMDEELRVRALTGLGAEEAEAAPAPARSPSRS